MSRMGLMLVLLAGVLLSLSGCSEESDPAVRDQGGGGRVYTEQREPCTNFNPLRNLYFGATHVHTALSYDAWSWDTRSGPEDAYRFAKGEPMQLGPFDETGQGTRTVQLEHPLDLTAVTDHSNEVSHRHRRWLTSFELKLIQISRIKQDRSLFIGRTARS